MHSQSISDQNRMPDGASLEELAQSLRAGGLVHRLLELARDEDLGPGGHDWTGELMFAPDQTKTVVLRSRSSGVLSGLAFLPDLLAVFMGDDQVQVEYLISDGQRLEAGSVIARLIGNARAIVRLERSMLNLISRLSGIATRTARFVDLVSGTEAKICDTRKTTPGLRVFEKYAVCCGGGTSHRMGLFDAVLIKDNHIAGMNPKEIATSLEKLAYTMREQDAHVQFVQIEVDSLDQLACVLEVGSEIVDMVLLDNMDADHLAQAVEMRDRASSRLLLEASGGISEDTVRSIAESGVDRISIGGLTHQAQSLDLGLDAE